MNVFYMERYITNNEGSDIKTHNFDVKVVSVFSFFGIKILIKSIIQGIKNIKNNGKFKIALISEDKKEK